MKYFVVLCLGMVSGAACAAAPEQVPDKSSVTQLIEQLGSASFGEREEATRLLLKLGDVPPELRAALKSSDAEVRRRASAVIDQIEKGRARRGLNEAAQFAENGEFDQAVERFVRWSEADPEGDSLRSLSRLAGRLLKLERQRFGKTPVELADKYSMDDLLSSPHPRRVCTSRLPLVYKERCPCSLRGAGVTVRDWCQYSLIVSVGDVILTHHSGCQNSVIFTTGSVTVEGRGDVFYSVIVSDVDVRVPGESLHGSVIIARGNVTLPYGVMNSVVFAGGNVKQVGKHPSLRNTVIREHDLENLGLIKFFDPKKAGIEVTAGEGGVKIKEVRKDKPFAAGLRAGDVILTIGAEKTPSPEVFRKVLRAALADNSPTLTFKIRRARETLLVPISMKSEQP